MSNTPPFVALATIALVFITACCWQAVSGDAMTWRSACAGVAALAAFALGLGCGERSKRTYCDELAQANRQLNAQVKELQDAGASRRHGAVEPAQRTHAGRSLGIESHF